MIVGVLLAAGSSTRFGSNKLLHPLDCGRPMALAALQSLAQGVDEVVAVVRPDDRAVIRLLAQARVRVLPNPQAARGMGASLAAGVGAAPDADGWLIALADMPEIPPSLIRQLAAQLATGTPLVAPRYRGRRGHPVGFGLEFFTALSQLDGDQGARTLLAQHAARMHLLDTEHPGVLRDIDRPSDLWPLELDP